MTSYVENEIGVEFPFSIEEIVDQIIKEVLDSEGCPYEVVVSVLLTDNEGVRTFNKEYRDIDKETDVLSFPNINYKTPSEFDRLEEEVEDYFDPDSGELVLGDIIISVEKIKEQAESYGHSERRELAFLLAHSMLHLCGYDHMEAGEAAIMEKKQEEILRRLHITRE